MMSDQKITAEEKIKELMRRVREMKPGGDLASLLTKELGELTALAQKEALAEREKTTRDRLDEADFSPSSKPSQ